MPRFIMLFGACIMLSGPFAFAAFGEPRSESPLEFLMNQNRRLFSSEPVRVDRPERNDVDRYRPALRSRPTRQPVQPTRRLARQPIQQPIQQPGQQTQHASEHEPTPNLERVICRRQCDGAQVVFGILPADERRRSMEAMCTAAGAGAPTQLVVEKFERDSAFAMTVQLASTPDLMSGRSALVEQPSATAAPPPAPCPDLRAPGSLMVPILADATLKYGDIVATGSGFRMFVGKGKPPFREKDFVDASRRVRGLGQIANDEDVAAASIDGPPDSSLIPR